MSTPSEATVASRSAAADRPSAGAGIAIAVIAGAQLMVALDVTIVNIALPYLPGRTQSGKRDADPAASRSGAVRRPPSETTSGESWETS